jgi:hypothetical protein
MTDETVEDEAALEVGKPKKWAAGIPGVLHSLTYAFEQMGGPRSARALARVNQKHGFDCRSCAWPNPERRKQVEFCETGARAVAEEATTRRVTPAFSLATPRANWMPGQTTGWASRAG